MFMFSHNTKLTNLSIGSQSTRLSLRALQLFLFLLLLLLLLQSLNGFVSAHKLRQVSHIFIRLLEEIRQTLVLLLIDELPVTLLIFSLRQ